MDPNFWTERWKHGDTGFHQADVNANLAERWDSLGLEASDRVLVPLCGKSLDMKWLRDRGHPVLGVELSPIAVRDFFASLGVEPEMSQSGPFEVSEANGIRILQGDFFGLRTEDLGGIRGVYDRAALIALPPNLRLAYARTLTEKLPRSVRMLLVSLESSLPNVPGPPFSVYETEVRELYAPALDITVLNRTPFEEPPPNLRARGHQAVANVVYALRRD